MYTFCLALESVIGLAWYNKHMCYYGILLTPMYVIMQLCLALESVICLAWYNKHMCYYGILLTPIGAPLVATSGENSKMEGGRSKNII